MNATCPSPVKARCDPHCFAPQFGTLQEFGHCSNSFAGDPFELIVYRLNGSPSSAAPLKTIVLPSGEYVGSRNWPRPVSFFLSVPSSFDTIILSGRSVPPWLMNTM